MFITLYGNYRRTVTENLQTGTLARVRWEREGRGQRG